MTTLRSVTRRDRMIRRIVIHYLVRECRHCSRVSAPIELARMFAHRHRLVYSNDPIPIASLLPA